MQPRLKNPAAVRRKRPTHGPAKLLCDLRSDDSNLAHEIAAPPLGSEGNRPGDWARAWRRSARRWESLAAPISSVTGWKVWNPGRYGERWHSLFRSLYPVQRDGILIFGLNPGPYGMAQTGIPFTDIKRLEAQLPTLAGAIRSRQGRLRLPGLAPQSLHPFLSRTFESSSVRVYRFLLFGWGTAERGWQEVAVVNGCSLLFMDPEGMNRTPADLYAAASRVTRNREAATQILERCLRARRLAARDAVRALSPRGVVLLGKDTQSALGEELSRLVGEAKILGWEHPARAVPDRWARGLLTEIVRRGWK